MLQKFFEPTAKNWNCIHSTYYFCTTTALFLGLCLLPCPARVNIASTITDVTVYSDRALVTRSVSVSLQAGENILEFAGLPLELDDNSLRVDTNNSPGVKLESIELLPVKPEAKPLDTKRLEEQIQTLEDQKNLLYQRLENNARRSEYLKTLADRVQNLISPEGENKITPADLRGFLELQASEDLALRENRLAIEVSLREVQNQIGKLREQLQNMRLENPVSTKKLIVVLTAEQETTVPLKISYLMTNASWTPFYDLRADIDAGTLELRYYANVSQATGEDWNNVQLTLSTARPHMGATMGELQPWRLSTLPATKKTEPRLRSKPSGEPNFGESISSAAPLADLPQDFLEEHPTTVSPALPKHPTPTTLEDYGTARVFRVPLPATIPSDNRPRRSTVTITRSPAVFRHIATPKLQQVVFIQAKVTNGREALLPGQTNLFIGEDFVGKGRIDFVAATAPFEVLLGVDDAVKIRRFEISRSDEITGLLNKRREISLSYRIEATNFRTQPIQLVVLDQVPISNDSDIHIRFESTPRPSRLDSDTGHLEWQLQLKPQQTVTIDYRIRVDTSPQNQIYGL